MTQTLQTFFDSQLTNEIKKYSTNFGDFITAGASVTGASANYVQSFGGAASGSCATAVAGGSIVTHTSPALTLTGAYTFTVTATISDGQTREAVWYVSLSR